MPYRRLSELIRVILEFDWVVEGFKIQREEREDIRFSVVKESSIWLEKRHDMTSSLHKRAITDHLLISSA